MLGGVASLRKRPLSAARHRSSVMKCGSFPPAYVRPFIKRGKADATDPEAISEGVTRMTMRFVPIKDCRAAGCRDGAKDSHVSGPERTQGASMPCAHLAELDTPPAWQRLRRWSRSYGTRQMLACLQQRASR